MFLKLLLVSICNYCLNPLVSHQVSEHTAFTSDPKTFDLVLVVSGIDYHVGLNITNARLAFPMRAWMSSSVFPFFHIMRLRYMNLPTSSMCSPLINTPPNLICISCVFVAVIYEIFLRNPKIMETCHISLTYYEKITRGLIGYFLPISPVINNEGSLNTYVKYFL